MAKRTPSKKEVYVDPSESTPEGIINIRRREYSPGDQVSTLPNVAGELGGTATPVYEGSADPDAEGAVTIIDSPYTGDVDEPYTEPVDSGTSTPPATLATPNQLTIVSQTARTTSDGSTVVDVVFEVEDVAGASNYEIRITKI